jgi:hypothetical protein
MSSNTKSLGTSGRNTKATTSRLSRLFRTAGTTDRARFQGLDTLEDRILLGGDHPSFALPLNVANSTVITLDGAGQGSDTGTIDPAMDDDLFSFVAPADDFVTVWADTFNTTSPSDLDSRVEVYAADGTIVASGSSSDILTAGFNNTGWGGFVATGGDTYFVRVLSDAGSGTSATGDYVIRVDAQSQDVAVGFFGQGSAASSITIAGNDEIFKVTTRTGDAWDSLATFYGAADPDLFDARLDIYGPDGQRIVFDSEAGRLSNPFAVARTTQDTTYYIRVRGDHFDPADQLSVGLFTMNADFSAELAPIDPVNRQIFTTSSVSGTDRVEGIMSTPMVPFSFSFDSFGTGLHIITSVGVSIPFTIPLDSPAIHIYDDNGVELGFNKLGGAAEIQIQLNADRRYHVVVESFDNASPSFGPGAAFGLFVEAHHTWNRNAVTGPIDDHVNLPTIPTPLPDFGSAAYQQLLNEFSLATPVLWSDPQLLVSPPLPTAPNGIVQGDKSYFVRGLARGRIHESGDSDLFKFVPPVDVLDQYTGNDDNNGSALFLGGQGNFTLKSTTPSPNYTPIVKPNLGIWDASDYWPVGGDFNGAVRSAVAWDPDGNGPLRTMMVVGGDFTQIGPLTFNHLAAWAFNPLAGRFEWLDLGGADGTVNALTTYVEPATGGGGGQNPPVLIIGGDFTMAGGAPASNLAQIEVINGGFVGSAFGGGTNGPVYALANWDPADVANEDWGPAGIAVGGQFTMAGSTAAANIAFIDPQAGALNMGDTNGPVYALQAYNFSEPGPNIGDPPEDRSTIYIGGSFTQLGGIAHNNIGGYYVFDDAGLNEEWPRVGGGTNGPVYAMEVWDRDGEGPIFGDQLAFGGDFTNAGNYIATFQSDEFFTGVGQLGLGMNAPVRTLHAFIDAEYDTDVGSVLAEPVLYAGGEFTMADGFNANRLASYKLHPIAGYLWFAMGDGTDNTVFAMADMNDEIAGQWDRDDRHATRVSMVLSGTTESFINTLLRVYDSNFNLIYTNDTIAPPFPDPSGMNDFSLAPNMQFEGLQVWGGETYYVEVTSVAGASTGRYTLNITSDAYPPDGIDVISTFNGPPAASAWGQAAEIPLSTGPNGGGDGRAFTAIQSTAFSSRSYEITPSGIARSLVSELGGISHILDTDLYKFRAPADGSAEIRIASMGIADEAFESITNLVDGSTETTFLQRTYNSSLDSRLRIYSNDFVLVAEGTFNPAVKGGMEQYQTGDFLRWFTHRDAAVTVNVVAGEEYFIEVSSAQADTFMTDPGSVEWRTATGGYDLLVNSMPNLFPFTNPSTGIPDDHSNILGTGMRVSQSTVIPIDFTVGGGSLTGVIDNHVFNPTDSDFFQFIAPAEGIASVTATPTSASNLNLSVTVFDAALFVVASGNAAAGEPITLGFPALQGDQFYIAIDGGTDPGLLSYRVDVSGLPYTSDHAQIGDWLNATELEVLDFLGIASETGRIEAPGDSDVFFFDTLAFDIAEVTVTSLEPTLDPIVRVFEVQEDPAGNPVLLQVAFNDNEPGSVNSRTLFPLTAPERTSLFTGNTYNKYFISVSGADPEADFGDYILSLKVTPTDDHPDDTQFQFASPISIDPLFGTGDSSGIIELSGDTDLFNFIAPAGGSASVTITSGASSTLRPSVWIYDSQFNRVTDKTTSQLTITGSDATTSTAVFSFDVIRGEKYFLVVGGVAGGTVTTDDGGFSVVVEAPTADDHANEGEFLLATQIPLSPETGDGLSAGTIGTEKDTDLFFFGTLNNDDYVISINSTNAAFNPIVQLFDLSQNSIITVTDGGVGDEDGLRDGNVTVTQTSTTIGEIFYILVRSDAAGSSRTGDYAVVVDGSLPSVNPNPKNDDHADAGQFSLATVINLSTRTGDGIATGTIELSGDTDLFQFTSLAGGQAFVQIVAPDGSLLDASMKIFDQGQNQIRFNSEGVPGTEASTDFASTAAGQIFYIEVDGVGSSVGSYSVRVDTAPDVFHLYFPEGFANPNIREFVSIANPNPFAVTYEITLYYEDNTLAPVTITPAGGTTIGAGARGGTTLSGFGSVLDGITPNEPYSIEITSNGALGGTFSHYDFDLGLGEGFTETTSTIWSFANVTRQPGAVNDFLVFFNPNPTDVVVTLTAFTSRGQVTLAQVLAGNRRGGWDIASTTPLPTETFGVTLTSRPVNPSDTHIGIVASQSHFDTAKKVGYAVLGNAQGGATQGVVANIANSTAIVPEVSIFNAGPSVASVTLRSTFLEVALPEVVTIIEVAAGETITLDAAGLGITQNQPVGLRYTSTSMITVLASEAFAGDADATQSGTQAGTSFFFGDAFINTKAAGTSYIETLGFYNPSASSLTVNIDLLFVNGDTERVFVTMDPDGFGSIKLHELDVILDRGGLQFFSIQVSAGSSFVVEMTHYDLFLGGGWSTGGAPLGLTNSLSSIGIGG